MSGHSHAKTVKRRKEAVDAQKGKIFSKLSRLITVAVREGGGFGNPEKNPRLVAVLEKARQANMPKENIDRAILKAVGVDSQEMERVIYEGFGPEGVAVIIDCITDNKNRTSSQLKSSFKQAGGRLAEPGAAAHFFKKRGLIKVKKAVDVEEQTLFLIDLGVEDIEESGGFLDIYVPADRLFEFREKIAKDFKVEKQQQVMEVKIKASLGNQSLGKLKKLIKSLEERDDVERVFVNVEF